MPDFKYWSAARSKTYMKAADYPDAARAAPRRLFGSIDELRPELWRVPQLNQMIRDLRKKATIEETDYKPPFSPIANAMLASRNSYRRVCRGSMAFCNAAGNMRYFALLVVALLTDQPLGAPESPLAAQTRATPGGCEDPVDQRPAGGACVTTVNGKVIDENGRPLPDLVISVCAAACYYGKTDDGGAFAVRVYSHLVIDQYATLVHGRPDHADYYTALPRAAGSTYTYAARSSCRACPRTDRRSRPTARRRRSQQAT